MASGKVRKIFVCALLAALSAIAVHDFNRCLTEEGGAELVDREIEKGFARGTLKNWTSVAFIDNSFNGAFTVFKSFFLVHPINWSMLQIWFSAFLPSIVWGAMEEDRAELKFAFLYFTIYQFMGVGIFFPLTSIYLIAKYKDVPKKTNFSNIIIGFLQLVSTVVPLYLLPHFEKESHLFFNTLVVFLLGPCLVPFLSFLPGFSSVSTATAERSKKARPYFIAIIAFAAGVGFLGYVNALDNVVSHYWLIREQPELALEHLTSNPLQKLLLTDFAASFLAPFFVVFAIGGVTPFLLTFFSSLIVGPPIPLAIFYIQREFKQYAIELSSSSKSAPSTKSTQGAGNKNTKNSAKNQPATTNKSTKNNNNNNTKKNQ